MNEQKDRIYAVIDLHQLKENIKATAEVMYENQQLILVIKADGYGHGASKIAETVEKDPEVSRFVWGFALATADEALDLKKSGIRKPILILGAVREDRYAEMIENEVRMTMYTVEQVKAFKETADRLQKEAYYHLKVDTGMGRIGISCDREGIETAVEMAEILKPEGIFSHLATADCADNHRALEQVDAFRKFVSALSARGIEVKYKHYANSAATVLFDTKDSDLLRLGITLYGLNPSNEVDFSCVPVKPLLSLYSEITMVKTVPAGFSIGYGATFILLCPNCTRPPTFTKALGYNSRTTFLPAIRYFPSTIFVLICPATL